MRWLIARYERVFALMGFQYPWYYMAIADVAIVATVLVAALQRLAAHPHGWQWVFLVLAVVVAIAPHAACLFIRDRGVFTPVLIVATVISVGLFWLIPTYADAATLLLVLGVTTGAAISTWKQTVFNMTLASITLATGCAAGLVEQGWLIAAMLAFGVAVGHLLQAQLALLLRERQARAARLRLDRSAIASEVHDVVAHSLSIVLLNVTGARRVLQQDNDIDEAVAALIDAETQGRAAMADIRRSIELLRADTEPATASPGLNDLDELVTSFRRVGRIVDCHRIDPPASLTRATELAIYRIVQESLTNASKHAPGVPVDLRIHPGIDNHLHITVRNPFPPDSRRRPGGSGLDGMRARAEHLGGRFRAGVEGGLWEVDAALPLSPETTIVDRAAVKVVADAE
jgi:signal transduction histidine kinase